MQHGWRQMLCSLLVLLAATAAPCAAGFNVQEQLAFLSSSRFSRLLKQDTTGGALPSIVPALCDPQDCCQKDPYASPYRLQLANTSTAVFTGRHYTTFYYKLIKADCNHDADNKGCCTSNITTIWIDVDPSLKVKFCKFNNSNSVKCQQDSFGFSLSNMRYGYNMIPEDGIPIAITVEGQVANLCPPPSLVPLLGFCEVIVENGIAAGSTACCPRSVSFPVNTSAPAFIPPEDSFECSSDIAVSGFKLEYDTTSSIYEANGMQLVDYSFQLVQASNCDADSVPNCCDASLLYLELETVDLDIQKVRLGATEPLFNTSDYFEPHPRTGNQSLIIPDLNLTVSQVAQPLPLVITVALASGVTTPPRLCEPTFGSSESCVYFVHSDDGLCCPTGVSTPMHRPPSPPAACSPSIRVPQDQTSMVLQYYEGTASEVSTLFNFLVASHSGAGCTKAYCADVCGWTLYIRDEMSSRLHVRNEDLQYSGQHAIQSGSDASITFSYGPSGSGTINYFINTPPGTTLAQLCRPNAVDGQGSKACAAAVRSQNSNVYTVVFFDESDVVIRSPAPPAPVCSAAQPMSSSCLRTHTVRYNTPNSKSTIVDVAFKKFTPDGICGTITQDPVAVRLFVKSTAVLQLQQTQAILPAGGVLDKDAGTITWTISKDASGGSFALKVDGTTSLAEVCQQGVLSDQAPGSCVVELESPSSCFRAVQAPGMDGSLVWAQPSASGGVSAKIVVPAVLVPTVVLAIAGAAAWFYYRKQRAGRWMADSTESPLSRPLAAAAFGHAGDYQPITHSDVHISLSPNI